MCPESKPFQGGNLPFEGVQQFVSFNLHAIRLFLQIKSVSDLNKHRFFDTFTAFSRIGVKRQQKNLSSDNGRLKLVSIKAFFSASLKGGF